ncbi:hypothetical protein DH2020_048065 [Rehmannia glutinosa]|uniref:Reverse transcriptase Ty1/copia-type domain-containing protein n=1 Tax=Rehmannia glutinosa TaxID=99300 RepID=A0ABR0U6M7_REHGL
MAAAKGWFLHQLDVNNAFLHGDLYEEVYMKPPPGYNLPNDNMVCKLTKSLYGLKQASRQWFHKLTSCLIDYGFCQSKSDSSFFIKSSSTSLTVLCVYVDDIILAGNNLKEIQHIKSHLDATFTIKDLGTLKYILGIEVARTTKGIALCQRKYALDILTETGYLGCKPSNTPMEAKIELSNTSGTPLPDPSIYRRLVGRLLYLTITRPELSYSIHALSQFMSNPRSTHLDAAHRVLRYIKSCPGKGLFYSSSSSLQLQVFTDADWARCQDTRRSVSGFAIYLGDSLISWRAKKQPTVSRSSTEAEYRAIALATCEVQWLAYLLQDLQAPITQPTNLYTDSKSAYLITQNSCHHEKTKHIQIDCHFVREKIAEGLIKVIPIPSSQQIADIMTKPLPPQLFHQFNDKLCMVDIHAQLAGGCQSSQS